MATLTSTITESISLNGADRGSTNTLSVASVTEVFHRIVTCPSGQDTTVATFQAAVNTSDNALDLDNVKYIRVTNLGSVPVNLSLQTSVDEDGTADASATILLDAGRSFIMGTPHDAFVVDDDAAGVLTTAALTDLESLLIDGHASTDCSVEVFIAS